uniref:Uncharacterized LOC101474050 n=2 Tax=Maylandia zebra TaxID=106582 RepID=A0A3P9B9I4_9CICH
MHFKHKGYFGVVLIYTITTIALPLVSRCEPTASSFQSNSPPDDSKGHLTTESSSSHSSGPDVGERLDLGSRRAEDLLNSDDLHSRKEKPSSSPEEKPEKRLRPKMASSSGPTGVSDRHNPRQAEDEPVYSYGDCREGKIKHVVYGKFVIAGQLEPNVPTLDYQSESSASVRSLGSQTRLRGHRVSSTVESWQRLLPVVECEEDGMTLTVRRRRAAQLLLDRATESSVPLSQLPPQCGYTLQTTWRDLRLMVPYYACHVIQKDGSYVLPLLWRGTPVKMSCPVSQISPHTVGLSSLCCSSHGMTVKVHESTPLEKQRVNVRGDWTPLALLAEQCGYTLAKQDADTVIAAPFITCGITEKDGEYILPLQIGKEIFTLACPMSSPEELSVNTQPLVNSPAHLTRGAEEPMLGAQEPFPWAPPFYLAPPYYPHPTYHHNYASPKVHASYDSPTPASLTPEPTSSSQLHPPVDFQPDYQPYYVYQMPFWEPYDSPPSLVEEMEDLRRENPERRKNQETPFLAFSEKHSVTPTGFPAQLEVPHFQPLRHDFNPYYHYYHHPKIPLSGKPQNPDSGLDVSHEISSAHLRKHEFSALAPNVEQSKSIRKVTSDQFPPPVSETTFYPYAQPENAKLVDKTLETHAPHLLNPYLYYYYFPHISRVEAERLVPSHPDMPGETNLSNSSPLPPSQILPVNEHNMNAYIKAHKNFEKYSTEQIKHPNLSAKVHLEHKDASRSASVSPAVLPPVSQGPHHRLEPQQRPPHTQSFINQLNPYQYYYHPYYHYSQMYYRPGNQVSPASPHLLQAPSAPAQHLTPPAQSVYGFHNWMHSPFYYLYYPSKVPEGNELHPTGSINSENKSAKSQLPSDFDYGMMAGYFNIPPPLHNPFHSLYSHYITQQHHNEQSEKPDEDAKENLDKVRDYLEAHTYTPSASPCGLGSVSDTDCSNSLGCCSNTVKGCTVGQYCVFAVPDSVVQPTVAPPAHSPEDINASCTLQRLTPDLDIYIVPLDGCGVNKHMLGETVVHLLEVRGLHPYQNGNSAHESSPLRFMVGCSSSADSPGEVKFHVMDEQPPLPLSQPTPAAVTVQLRIAEDESFTSYHPEAHLPLSLLQGRTVYVEVSLKDPSESTLVLLVHSCLAYTDAPYPSGILVYDGCSSLGVLQMLPTSDLQVRKIAIYSFLSLPPHMTKGGSLREDPEIHFLCLTELCSDDCTLRCLEGPNTG